MDAPASLSPEMESTMNRWREVIKKSAYWDGYYDGYMEAIKWVRELYSKKEEKIGT